MVYFREKTTNGGEEDDQDRPKTSAVELSSSGDEFMPPATSGHGDSLGNAPAEGGDCDGDLLSACCDLERGVLQWLRALDLHVVGACRVDERLKPLFKTNISSGIAEDRLVSQLSQHFEATEIGTLARCLCVPLVSIRVGKVDKEGNLLCPTATKGYLQLTLLPTSDMRLSFCGDNGVKENLAVVSRHRAYISDVSVEEISADGSGRTFLLGFSQDRLLYFWCSEKSRLLGSELLSKMKDLLSSRPSLSQLTGISEQRLHSFAAHLRAYLPRLPVVVETSNDRPSAGEEEDACPTVQAANLQECSRPALHVQDPPMYHRLPEFIPSSLPLPLGSSAPSLPALFSPHYCWCPPRASPAPPTPPELLLLPPLLPELPEAGPRSLDLPLPLIFPPLPPALTSQQPGKSQQIPTFMSDPIVHVPVIDVYSSGQGYLVSAGPAISSALPGPLLPESESHAEKRARETLRMLMASAPSAPQLLDVFPAVFVAGSRGLYTGTNDVGGNQAPRGPDDDVDEDFSSDA